MSKFVQATTKGQITLPAKWRRRVSTNQFIIEEKEGYLKVIPVDLDTYKNEYTVFDALRDNKGQGIAAEDLIKILEKINTEE